MTSSGQTRASSRSRFAAAADAHAVKKTAGHFPQKAHTMANTDTIAENDRHHGL